jgi:hypothetical protein
MQDEQGADLLDETGAVLEINVVVLAGCPGAARSGGAVR